MTKDMIKSTDEQLDEEIHRVKPQRVPSTGASVLMELEYATLLACIDCSPPWRFSEPLRIFMDTSSCEHDS